jgi:hypothetical protein
VLNKKSRIAAAFFIERIAAKLFEWIQKTGNG